MRVLLVSTYDLGRQPFGLASPAAWLRAAGVDVQCADVSRGPIADEQFAAASLIAFYLPMHTATRLASPIMDRARQVNPSARLCAYGLYAPLNETWLRQRGVADVLGPEAEGFLVELALAPGTRHETHGPALDSETPAHSATGFAQAAPRRPEVGAPGQAGRVAPLPRLHFITPDREGLPPLQQYASLRMPDGSRRIVGSTDATRGCKHLCRHCPIVPVYKGQFRVIPLDVVMADVRAQVAAGAQHISFADPDFLNGPTHARHLLDRLSAEFPGLSYDVTIKIEHLRQHADLVPRLRDTGCLFITSAVEAIDDAVLGHLKKGHSRHDFIEVVRLCRSTGVTLVPTFIPFTPWTTLEGYVELLTLLEELELVEQVAPIQLAMRLLVTAGSPLLDLADVRNVTASFDAASLAWPWRHPEPRVDALQVTIMRMVGAAPALPRSEVFARIAAVAREQAGLPPVPHRTAVRSPVPYLSEPWYCCAEPMEIV